MVTTPAVIRKKATYGLQPTMHKRSELRGTENFLALLWMQLLRQQSRERTKQIQANATKLNFWVAARRLIALLPALSPLSRPSRPERLDYPLFVRARDSGVRASPSGDIYSRHE
uniref:Transposase n=1 Tax=Peronospora matthiolae TaxID=2874970 RepID=A0AAV1UDI3_9STRA